MKCFNNNNRTVTALVRPLCTVYPVSSVLSVPPKQISCHIFVTKQLTEALPACGTAPATPLLFVLKIQPVPPCENPCPCWPGWLVLWQLWCDLDGQSNLAETLHFSFVTPSVCLFLFVSCSYTSTHPTCPSLASLSSLDCQVIIALLLSVCLFVCEEVSSSPRPGCILMMIVCL